MTYLIIFLVVLNVLLVIGNLYLTFRWARSVKEMGDHLKLKESVVLDHIEELEKMRIDSYIKGDVSLEESVENVKNRFIKGIRGEND